MEDVTFWIDTAAQNVQAREGARITEEDERHLAQIREWCENSPLLWKILSRVGWDINEG